VLLIVNIDTNVKRLLYTYGFADDFMNSNKGDGKLFPGMFKQRLVESYVQNWHGSIENCNVLDLCKNCKTNLSYEIYLDFLPRSLRMYISRIRMSLRIQTCRYYRHYHETNDMVNAVILLISKMNIIIFWFVLVTIIFVIYIYIKYVYVRPSMFKFTQLLQTSILLVNLARYIKESLVFRNAQLSI
jgi:hypothetical protein